MKLFKDTASKLEQAREDLLACEQAIEALKADRLAKLLDADPADLARIDLDLDARQRQAGIFQDRIAVLESKIASEQAEKRKQDFSVTVVKLEKGLPERHAAAQEVESAIRALVAAATKLKDVSARLSTRPNGVVAPAWFGGFKVAYQLGELVRDCFVVPVRPYSPTPPTAKEYADRLYSAAERAAGFAAALRESDAQIIADLKNPSPQTDEAAA